MTGGALMRVDGPEPPPPPIGARLSSSSSSSSSSAAAVAAAAAAKAGPGMVMAPPAEEGEVVMFDLRMPPPVPRATLRHALQRWQYEGAEMDAILHGLEEHVSALEMGAVRMRIEQRRLLVVGEWNGLELGSGQRDGLARHYSRCCRVHLSKPRAVKYTIAASASAAAAAVGGGDSGGQGLEL